MARLALGCALLCVAAMGDARPVRAEAANALGPELVLEPGQARAAQRLVGGPGAELAPGWRLEQAEALPDRVVLRLRGPEGTVAVDVLAPDAEGTDLVRTARGALRAPPEAPPALVEALRAALEGAGPTLRWRRLVSASDPRAARAAAEALRARLQERLSAATRPGQAAGAARDTLDDGAQLTPSAGPPEPGALSRWLSQAAPDAPVPCPPRGACWAEQILRDLEAGRLNPSRVALAADEPRVLARAARLAAGTGHPELATAWLAQALMSPQDDAEARAQAAAFGWSAGASSAAGAAGEEATVSAEPAAPKALPWLVLAALALAAAALLAWRTGRTVERLALALGLMLAVAMAMWLPHRGPPEPPPPTPADGWLALGRGAERCQPSPPALTSRLWQVVVRCADGSAVVRLDGVAGGAASASPASDALHAAVTPLGGAAEPSAEVERWVARVLRDARSQGLTLAPAPPSAAAAEPTMAARIASHRPLERAALLLAGPVCVLAGVCALALVLLALRSLTRLGRADRRAGLALAGAATVALLTHALAPSRLVMVYDGYQQTQALLAMEPLRYGAGTNWLYAPWLMAWPDHAAVQLANRVYGLLGLVALWALAARLWPHRPRRTALLAWLTATAPLLWRDHASESILVAPTAMLLLGALGVAAASRRVFPLLLAAPCLATAALSRPEFGPVALILAALVLAARRPRWGTPAAQPSAPAAPPARSSTPPWRAWASALLALGAGLALLPPHLAITRRVVDWLVATHALPGLDGLAARALHDAVTLGGLHVVLFVGPPLLALFLLTSLLTGRDAWLAAGLMLLALCWTALTRVDLPEVSIPRVHAPAWLLFALVGALGADWLWEASARLGSPRTRAGVRGALAAAWLVLAALTAARLYRPTNADAEEALIRATVDALPEGYVCLATLSDTDPPAPGKTPRSFPFYLLAERHPRPTLTGLAEVDPTSPICRDGSFALLGMRCYMALREDATAGPPPPGAPMVEGCEAFRRRFPLTPVVAVEAPNRGDAGFALYPSGPTLPIGLYRIR
ncbi:MAG: hypothetical protein H6744_12130 [Deltaproteobacteria bacterium]|nr:hypothetical protein [Deltaproteobacteria bacterium]